MNFKLAFFLICWGFPQILSGQKVGENLAPDKKIPTLTFCEIVKNSSKYFDQKVRITATFTQATEAQYLSDDENCPLSHDDQIGVGYAETHSSKEGEFNQSIRKISSVEFGSRAVVRLVGVLRNVSRRDFAWYRYRFDILKFEEITQVVEEYRQDLVDQITYRAAVQKENRFGLTLVKSYKLSFHYAQRFEWTNLKDFPELKNFEKRTIVFTVLLKEIKQMTADGWNVLIRCKIIRLE